MAQITDNHLDQALTVGQVLDDLKTALEEGNINLNSKMVFGNSFLGQCFAVKSVVVVPNLDGSMIAGLSDDSEESWMAAFTQQGIDVKHTATR